MRTIQDPSRWVGAFVVLTSLGLAGCGDGGGGSSPPSPTTPAPLPAPTPAPLPAPTPLSFLDAPTEPVRLTVGQRGSLVLRLSAGVDHTVTAYRDDYLSMTGTVRDGVVRLELIALLPHTGTLTVTVQPPGYTSATVQIAYIIQEAFREGTIDGRLGIPERGMDAFACRDVSDLVAVARIWADQSLSLEETQEAILDYLLYYVDYEAWGWFDDGDPIEWDGEEDFIEDLAAIRVWGTPNRDEESTFDRSPWWVFKMDTSFGSETALTGMGIEGKLHQATEADLSLEGLRGTWLNAASRKLSLKPN